MNLFAAEATDRLTINGQAGDDTINASGLDANKISLTINGGLGADTMIGSAGDDLINGGADVDQLQGGADNDTFVFAAGQADGDSVVDFAGNGAAIGDSFRFVGFGTAGAGATFTQIGVTNQWQIHSALDGHNEIITLQNGTSVDGTDYIFV